MLATVLIIIAFVAVVYVYMQSPVFGKSASGQRLQLMQASPNYSKGAFQNIHTTPQLAEDTNFGKVFYNFFFKKSKRLMPASVIPSVRTDLKSLDPDEDTLVWFGHSSYLMQLSGKRFLVDPVFCGHASPLSFTTHAFHGSDVYSADDMPDIDYLIITHDHYDHLDHKTVKALQPKVKQVITGLGVGAHLERWGYDINKIIEKNWNQIIELPGGFTVHTAPSRHFAGRGFKRNVTLWSSFVLITPRRRIYIGGDSGYDTHFAEIGAKYGPFDLVILEDGQYNHDWKYIHMLPEENVQAAIDLKAKKLLPVHWGKFALGLHDWDEPIKRVCAEAAVKQMPLLHPMIGQPVNLDDAVAEYPQWWKDVK